MIKNIIFDLGNVLVKVHFNKFRKDLISYGCSAKSVDKFFSMTDLKNELESGVINFDDFYKISIRILDKKISKKKFKIIFNDIFSEMPGINDTLRKLFESKKYFIVMLSNTNNQHFNYIKNKFSYLKYFHKFALSYKMNLIKPDIKIYDKVLKMYNLLPEETVFIDDLNENCFNAAKSGLKTINFKSISSFEKKLNKLINNASITPGT